MTFESRQLLYRIFWRLSIEAVLEEDLVYKRGILAAMIVVEELRRNGKTSMPRPGAPFDLAVQQCQNR